MPYIPPIYPSTIPDASDLPDRVDDVDWLYAARYNEIKKEMIAIMTELGTLPKGAYADVKTRLDASVAGGPDKQNLDVKINVTNPTYQIDIDADYLQVQDKNLSSVNLTTDITSSGANGLDTGSKAANTWYSIWVIYNPTSDTAAGLLSISTDSPTMPSGYTKKRRVGWVRNDASSNFIAKMDLVEGAGYHYRGDPSAYDWETGDFTTDDTWKALDCSAIVPPGAKAIQFVLQLSDDLTEKYFMVQKSSYSHDRTALFAYTQVADVPITINFIVSCDSNRILKYYGQNTTYSTIFLVIVGWLF